MNTSRLGSSTACHRCSALRAAATSGLSCSAARRLFFKAQLQMNQESGDCRLADRNFLLCQTDLELRQCDVRLFRYQIPDHFLMRRENELLVATKFGRADATRVAVKLEEAHHRADAHATLLRGVGYGSAAVNRLNHPPTQVLRIRLRHPYWPPPSRELESYSRGYGNPRFSLFGKRSRLSLSVW